MTTFTAQVSLHSADTIAYRKLYSEMEKEAFAASVKSLTSGPVEFKCSNKASLQEVNDAVYRAASKTGKQFSFTVMKDKNLERLESRMRQHLQHHD
jgi:hypothetical protein